MDYTLSNSYDTDAGTGNRMHEDAKSVPTVVSGKDMNSVVWSLMEIVKAAGLSGIQFDKANPASYQRLLQAFRLLTAGRILAANEYATTQVFNPTNALTKAVLVRGIGGGGAGGGSLATGAGGISFGSGGGAGAFFEGLITTGFTGVLMTIGAAGAQVLGASGGDGGTTSFGSLLTAAGGKGGLTYGPTSPPLTAGGGNSATASGGYLRVPGYHGGDGFMTAANFGFSGKGADSLWGRGGGAQNGSGDGASAFGNGAGGGGAMSPQSSTVRYGGVGSIGKIVVMELG